MRFLQMYNLWMISLTACRMLEISEREFSVTRGKNGSFKTVVLKNKKTIFCFSTYVTNRFCWGAAAPQTPRSFAGGAKPPQTPPIGGAPAPPTSPGTLGAAAPRPPLGKKRDGVRPKTAVGPSDGRPTTVRRPLTAEPDKK